LEVLQKAKNSRVYEYYKMVEKACQDAIDKSNKARDKARAQEMSALGHL
jgi:hypothetical protein